MAEPLFSIIAVHYQGTIPHEIFCRGIQSIRAQTFTDYEILCYHDGPLIDSSVSMPVEVICSDRRFNDWGHSLRDMGIRAARGKYILHFNADNTLEPNALEMIAAEIARPSRIFNEKGEALDGDSIILFPVRMWGLQRVPQQMVQWKDRQDFYEIVTGNPPIQHNIDCMQLVMKRELWLAEGGWRDKSEGSDGKLYSEFCFKYGYRMVGPVLGDHY